MEESGFLNVRTDENDKFKNAFNQLKMQNVIYDEPRIEKIMEGKKIKDVKFTVGAHDNFIKDLKAGQKRYKDNFLGALDKGLVLDNEKLTDEKALKILKDI